MPPTRLDGYATSALEGHGNIGPAATIRAQIGAHDQKGIAGDALLDRRMLKLSAVKNLTVCGIRNDT